MKHLRTYTDSDDIAHYDSHDLQLQENPPEGLVERWFSGPTHNATTFFYVDLPGGYKGYWHPSPTRQLYIYLSGQIQIELDSGEVEVFTRGDTLLMEHLVGKGHLATNITSEPVLGILVQLESD